MRSAIVFFNNNPAGTFVEISREKYEFRYNADYSGSPISLAMPVKQGNFIFLSFPAFFEGLLPEGSQLEALLRRNKIDRTDYFSQLMAVGEDCVGAVSVREVK